VPAKPVGRIEIDFSKTPYYSDIEWGKFHSGTEANAGGERLRFALEDSYGDVDATYGTFWTVEATPTPPKKEPIEFLFDEERIIQKAFDHIKSTYDSHYAGQTQPTELIVDSGNGIGFTVGNIIKYAARLGKKDGWNQKDIYKIIHYAVMLSYIVEKEKAS
jgi:hypothetical protein